VCKYGIAVVIARTFAPSRGGATDPAGYLGGTDRFIDRVLALARPIAI